MEFLIVFMLMAAYIPEVLEASILMLQILPQVGKKLAVHGSLPYNFTFGKLSGWVFSVLFYVWGNIVMSGWAASHCSKWCLLVSLIIIFTPW